MNILLHVCVFLRWNKIVIRYNRLYTCVYILCASMYASIINWVSNAHNKFASIYTKPINLKRNLLFHWTESQRKLINFFFGRGSASIVQRLLRLYSDYRIILYDIVSVYIGSTYIYNIYICNISIIYCVLDLRETIN